MVPGCKFCDKKGLPVLLVRYAISPEIAKTKPLPTSMKPKLKDKKGADAGDAPDMKTTCGYTTRILRSGYLYQYDEARKFWKTYYVTQGGYLYELMQDGSDPPIANIQFHCDANTDGVMASIVTIPDAKKATTVWFGFAEVLWTKETYKQHEDAAYRKRHMRAFDVAKWLGNQSGTPNAAPMKELGNLVAEYQLDQDQGNQGFRWDAAGFASRKAQLPNLIDASHKLTAGKPYPGAIVALDDPTGMAQELDFLMFGRFTYFNEKNKAKFGRSVNLAGAIDQIKDGIKETALISAIENEKQAIYGTEEYRFKGRALTYSQYDHYTPAQRQEQLRKLDEEVAAKAKQRLKQKDLTELEQIVWKKYQDCLRPQAREDFEKSYTGELKAFDQAHIAPLAKAHATWMADPIMENYFECNHDTKDIHSGIAYLATVSLCVGSTQDKGSCYDAYQKLLEKDIKESSSYLLRAWSLNQQKLIEKIAEISHVEVDWRAIPWSAITDAYKSTLDALESAEVTVINKLSAKLIAQVTAPMQRALEDLILKPGAKKTLGLVLGMAAGKPLHRVELVGTNESFANFLVERLSKAANNNGGKQQSPEKLRKAIKNRLDILEIKGAPINGDPKRMQWLVFEDEELLKGLNMDGLTSKQRAIKLAGTLRAEDLPKIDLDKAFEHFKEGGRLAVLGAFSIALQVFIVRKLKEDLEKNKDKKGMDYFDPLGRLIAGWAAGIGFTFDMAEKGLKGILSTGLKRGERLLNILRIVGEWGGKGFGAVAGGILAVLDGYQAYTSFQDNQTGMMALYLTSAAAGIAVTVCFLINVVLIGWIALVILLAVTVLIEIFKDNKIQMWLRKTLWGKSPNEHFDEKQEMDEFKALFAGE